MGGKAMTFPPVFTCAICSNAFFTSRADDEAWEEARRRFGPQLRREDVKLVCADCYPQLEPVH
jgi:hypothetical protein